MVPLVRSRYCRNFVTAMRDLGIPIQDHLRKSGLSERVLERPDTMIPSHQLWDLAYNAALQSGKLDLGWDACDAASLEDYGSFSRTLFSKQSLYTRLLSFCTVARSEYSEADFNVRSVDGQLLFVRGPIDGNDLQVRQVELYLLSMMLATVRSVLGPLWKPPAVALQSFFGPDIECRFDSAKTNLVFNSRETIITIAAGDVERSIDAYAEPFRECHGPGEDDQVLHALESVVGSYLDDKRLTINFLAHICGANPRKLQRLLEERGTSFSDILTRQRISVGSDLLKNSDIPIAEIAYQLGYSSQSHFSRMFRNNTGTTPLKYRCNQRN